VTARAEGADRSGATAEETGRLGVGTALVLVLAASLPPLALGLFVPSMPTIERVFGAGYEAVQLTLSLYIAGLAVGQLAYGPLSDRFGRRPAMIGGLAVFTIASVGGALAGGLGALIVARAAQALGGCAGMVLARAVIRDRVGADRAAGLIAYLTVAYMVAPMIGPVIGGWLDETVGWRAGFVLVAALGALAVALTVRLLPETRPDASAAAAEGAISGLVASFGRLVRMPAFLRHAALTALTTAAFFGFMGGGPAVAIGQMGISPTEYGLFIVLAAAGYAAGNLTAGRLSARFGIEAMIRAGTVVSLVAAIALAGLTMAGRLDPMGLFVTMAVLGFGNGMTMPNALAGAVSALPERAGAASGLAGFAQMGTGALASAAVGAMLGDTPHAMVAMTTLATVAAFVVSCVTVAGPPAPPPPEPEPSPPA